MADIASQLEGAVGTLRTALQSGNDITIDRSESVVRDLLFEREAFRTIGDERLLLQADHLLTAALGVAAEEDLVELRAYLRELSEIHDKCYAILNAEIDLESLLLGPLMNWSGLSDSVSVSLDATTKSELHQHRQNPNSEQALELFFRDFLNAISAAGFEDVASQLGSVIRQVLEGYRRIHSWHVYALFATSGKGDTYGVKVTARAAGTGKAQCVNKVSPDMTTSADRAVVYATENHPHTRTWDFVWEISRSDLSYDGESIGLALAVAIQATLERIDIDAYTAFTGKVETDGTIRRVEHIAEKLQAAAELGIRRVFIPQDNFGDVDLPAGLRVIPVVSVAEVVHRLRNASFRRETDNLRDLAKNKIQEVTMLLRSQNIHLVSEIDEPRSCIRVEYTDRRSTVPLLVYYAQSLNHVVQGKDSTLKQHVQAACSRVFGEKVVPASTELSKKPETRKYSVKDAALQDQVLRHLLQRGDGVQEQENNCIFRIKVTRGGQSCFVRQFTNGTLTVAGTPPLLDIIDTDIRGLLGVANAVPEGRASDNRLDAQIEAVRAIELGTSWIGTDEAGKGDYFGPLVAAAVFVNEEIAAELRKIGVKDSKALSDRRNVDLADAIRRVCGKHAHIVVIPPERYNALYDQFQHEGKNLNTLLAWGHTRALEDILTEFPQDQVTVIVDKFGDEQYIRSKLLSKARQTRLNLIQLPKAEENIAVAAASILARAQFLQALTRMSEQYRLSFPKGASDPRILEIGKQIVRNHGADELRKVAKMHFKTTKTLFEG